MGWGTHNVTRSHDLKHHRNGQRGGLSPGAANSLTGGFGANYLGGGPGAGLCAAKCRQGGGCAPGGCGSGCCG